MAHCEPSDTTPADSPHVSDDESHATTAAGGDHDDEDAIDLARVLASLDPTIDPGLLGSDLTSDLRQAETVHTVAEVAAKLREILASIAA